jgi:hypothetical protein
MKAKIIELKDIQTNDEILILPEGPFIHGKVIWINGNDEVGYRFQLSRDGRNDECKASLADERVIFLIDRPLTEEQIRNQCEWEAAQRHYPD